MDVKSVLKEAGLNESEVKVYLALLKRGPSLAGVISRITGIHRRNVYDITERLIQKGVIGYIIENNRRLFEAVDPQRFLEVLKQRELELLKNLPALREIYLSKKEKQETNFYKGREGLKNVFQDQLVDNKEVLILGASKSAFEVLPFYFKWYDKDRIKRKIKVRMIASDRFEKKIPLSEIRFLPKEYANPLAINIYKDKVALILWSKEKPLAIVVKNKEISDSYRKYFELMWVGARKIKNGEFIR